MIALIIILPFWNGSSSQFQSKNKIVNADVNVMIVNVPLHLTINSSAQNVNIPWCVWDCIP